MFDIFLELTGIYGGKRDETKCERNSFSYGTDGISIVALWLRPAEAF